MTKYIYILFKFKSTTMSKKLKKGDLVKSIKTSVKGTIKSLGTSNDGTPFAMVVKSKKDGGQTVRCILSNLVLNDGKATAKVVKVTKKVVKPVKKVVAKKVVKKAVAKKVTKKVTTKTVSKSVKSTEVDKPSVIVSSKNATKQSVSGLYPLVLSNNKVILKGRKNKQGGAYIALSTCTRRDYAGVGIHLTNKLDWNIVKNSKGVLTLIAKIK